MPDPDDDRTDPDSDRPRRRRYDDDDRPRPKSGGPSGLTIGLIVGAVLMIFLCVGGGLVALLLPAVSKVREAAARAKESNNMKQIAIAYHMDNDVTGRGFYGPYAHDQRGEIKKGLSHRVSLLPYLEQDAVYRQFDLDKAWDSPANRPLADTIIVTFTSPNSDGPMSANTPFRSFVGGGALFNEDGSPVKLADIQDGSSNTILFVRARDAVPWAQPKEIPYAPGSPLPQLGPAAQPGGFNVAMADGSVRFVPASVSQQSLRAAITRAGGDFPGTDW